MQFQVLHQSSGRVRLRATFPFTEDVKYYLEGLTSDFPDILRLDFYEDPYVVAIHVMPGRQAVVAQLWHLIQKDKLEELYRHPQHHAASSPYALVSSAVGRHYLFKWFMPVPVRLARTLWKALGYFRDAWRVLRQGKLTMEILDCSAILVSLAMKRTDTASAIMFILELGETLNYWTQKRSLEDLEASIAGQGRQVWLLKGDHLLQIDSQEVQVGDVLVFYEGSELLFDGIVLNGRASVNESSLTGESFPVIKAVGDEVYSNTVLTSGELHVRVENPTANYRIQELVKLMQEAAQQEGTYQYKYTSIADRIVKYNFLGAALTYILTGSFTKAISFLLVDYSCALKLSTPMVYLSAIKQLMHQQVVVKNSTVLDQFDEVDTLVFDKTGTITTSRPLIEEVIPFHGYSAEDVIMIGACLEEHIYHPIAHALVDKAAREGIIHEEMHTELNHIASKGIRSEIDGNVVVIGSLGLMEESGIEIEADQSQLIRQKETHYNLLYLGYRQKLIAMFCVAIPVRHEAHSVLHALKGLGKHLVLLTGDTAARTNRLVADLPFDEVHTSMTPVTKFDYVQRMQAQGHRVLMIGDGLNDSAALSASDVGVVMGEGAEVSKQISDIMLPSNNLASLLTLHQVSVDLKQEIQGNVRDTIAINSGLIGLGVLNWLKPSSLAILHNMTTFGILCRSYLKGNVRLESEAEEK